MADLKVKQSLSSDFFKNMDKVGEEARAAAMQKTAWDLGKDKSLSPTVKKDLREQADAFAKNATGNPTIKDFREDMIKGLEKNGVGEKDAISLMDQFIESDFSNKDESHSLKEALPDYKMAQTQPPVNVAKQVKK